MAVVDARLGLSGVLGGSVTPTLDDLTKARRLADESAAYCQRQSVERAYGRIALLNITDPAAACAFMLKNEKYWFFDCPQIGV